MTTTLTTQPFDEARAEQFGRRIAGVLDHGCLGLLLSVGHRTGLLDTLGALDAPATSAEIARAAALDERYVRELLGGLVVGEIVTYEPATRSYRLPPEHATALTSAGGPDNLAFFMQYLPLMGSIEPEIVRVFRDGGGLPYEAYDSFQTVQRDETSRVYDAALTGTILPLAPGVIERLQAGIDVLDVGTGAGHAVNVMARDFGNSRFVGVDISTEGIGLGRAEAEQWGLTNVDFWVGDAAEITGRYDLITAFDTIHDQARPTEVLASICAALAEDGVFLMGDIDCSSNLEENVGNPMAPTIFAFSVFHCLTVSLAYGGEGLGTAWGRQLARQRLTEAGFTDVTATYVDGDPLNVYFVARKR